MTFALPGKGQGDVHFLPWALGKAFLSRWAWIVPAWHSGTGGEVHRHESLDLWNERAGSPLGPPGAFRVGLKLGGPLSTVVKRPGGSKVRAATVSIH
jgi:hypothetical protein